MYTNEEAVDKQESTVKSESLKKVRVWKNKILNRLSIEVKKNRYMLATLGAFLIFSIVNAMMICTFFKLMLSLK